ncbi:MAG: hypothetical protein HFG34_00435 [Eubacterium sp.]|nr:hypothetical protein [Eubacterium sp.]
MGEKTKKANDGLFPVFGEFDSHEEINAAAEGLLQEGDQEGLRTLAAENGLEEEAELYLAGDTAELCDPVSAALGKIKVEKEHENNYLADDIAEYLAANCDDIEFALSVRKKGKRLTEAGKRVMEEAKKHRTTINKTACWYCGPMKGYQLIREYYREGGSR